MQRNPFIFTSANRLHGSLRKRNVIFNDFVAPEVYSRTLHLRDSFLLHPSDLVLWLNAPHGRSLLYGARINLNRQGSKVCLLLPVIDIPPITAATLLTTASSTFALSPSLMPSSMSSVSAKLLSRCRVITFSQRYHSNSRNEVKVTYLGIQPIDIYDAGQRGSFCPRHRLRRGRSLSPVAVYGLL